MKMKILAFLPIFFVVLTSMSECENREGPLTTVKGRVEDFSTGEGYGDIVLQIKRQSSTIGGKPTYRDFDTVKTDINGNYKLDFIPKGIGRFSIAYKDYDLRKRNLMIEYSGDSNDLEEGKENEVNFKLSKLVNLEIKLKNSSDFGYSNYRLSANCCFNYQTANQGITKDTTLVYKVPRLKNLILTSYFHNNYQDQLVKEAKVFYISDRDTSIQIIN